MSTTPPPAVPVDKPTLVAMLEEASELEHVLCCQYLYAAFSVKQGGDPWLTPSQAARTAQWQQQITKIAVQEMSHLMMASNLLTAVGAEPHLWRPNFPQPASRYSEIGLPSMLSPLDSETVSRFTCWEKPEVTGWWDEWCRGCAARAMERVGVEVAEAEPPPFTTIGQLYGEIDDALKANPGWIDPSTVSRQVTSRLVPFSPRVGPVAGYDDAHACIDLIVREGEGTPDWDSMSHFAYFHQIVNELASAEQAGETFVPGQPTVDNPAYSAAYAPPGANLIDDPAASAVGLLLNDVYMLLVQVLTRLFTPEGETDDQRAGLANAALALMPLAVKPLGILLARMPAGGQYPGKLAGASFELPQPVWTATGQTEDARSALGEHMAEVTTRCRLLTLDPPPGLAGANLDALGIVAKNLETLVPLFDPGTVSAR